MLADFMAFGFVLAVRCCSRSSLRTAWVLAKPREKHGHLASRLSARFRPVPLVENPRANGFATQYSLNVTQFVYDASSCFVQDPTSLGEGATEGRS